MTRRRRFQRPLGELRYRKMFVIAAEGEKTEPQYFAIFNTRSSVVHVKCIKGRQASSPPQVLRRMRENLNKEGLKKSDEAWLVVDKNGWTDEHLEQLHQWSKDADNYGFALSNPKFEYWLLLHFEDGAGIASSRNCLDRLKRYLPDYDKGIDPRIITQEMIDEAIQRAKRRDNPPCIDWPRTIWCTTVYRLVENILRTR
ncbi:MAG: RloB domain-containing protein [Desulfobacteraceae bacterium]|nr:MAG: RloB domain-containing protein [Desulfobacteraceae bacterium]